MLLLTSIITILFIAILAIHTFLVRTNTYNMNCSARTGNVKIIQISDIHGRTHFINGTLSRLVNNLKPNVVCITGDLASNRKQLPKVLSEIKRIQCKYIFFIPGNYEREELTFINKHLLNELDYENLKKQLKEIGVFFLENQSQTLEFNGSYYYFYGFDNSIYGNEKLPIDDSNIEKADKKIFLAHSPNIVHLLRKQKMNYNLLMTGHTHGGQVRLFNKTIGAYKHFHIGVLKEKEEQFFAINRGLGTVKIPVRINCPPEISVYIFD
ncbi:hypothetical protein BAMA_06635 [Bacillus manliponensis]|uniref:Calcineurin-like phosphoesterase domain-containing protein n=1 Tax=Bacillus manliponensis TaxID=574376 RepID=A0A073K7I9_9BACI|nr:metallophosphoesterase [Bacillus manliponensis]KEK18233.1 hypothetical protein BAMA_06635 [Bacillus manliponensis]